MNMIKTKHDIYIYISEDRKAYGKKEKFTLRDQMRNWIFPDNNWEYVKCLRKLECYTNSGNVLRYVYAWKLGQLRKFTNIHLEPNVAGAGLHILHGNIVVSPYAKLGCNCKIAQFVTIGSEARYDRFGAPKIGDRVFIGAGAQIIGDITIADDVVIGANAVVTKDILEPGITIAGVPARKVSNEGSYHFLNRK